MGKGHRSKRKSPQTKHNNDNKNQQYTQNISIAQAQTLANLSSIQTPLIPWLPLLFTLLSIYFLFNFYLPDVDTQVDPSDNPQEDKTFPGIDNYYNNLAQEMQSAANRLTSPVNEWLTRENLVCVTDSNSKNSFFLQSSNHAPNQNPFQNFTHCDTATIIQLLDPSRIDKYTYTITILNATTLSNHFVKIPKQLRDAYKACHEELLEIWEIETQLLSQRTRKTTDPNTHFSELLVSLKNHYLARALNRIPGLPKQKKAKYKLRLWKTVLNTEIKYLYDDQSCRLPQYDPLSPLTINLTSFYRHPSVTLQVMQHLFIQCQLIEKLYHEIDDGSANDRDTCSLPGNNAQIPTAYKTFISRNIITIYTLVHLALALLSSKSLIKVSRPNAQKYSSLPNNAYEKALRDHLNSCRAYLFNRIHNDAAHITLSFMHLLYITQYTTDAPKDYTSWCLFVSALLAETHAVATVTDYARSKITLQAVKNHLSTELSVDTGPHGTSATSESSKRGPALKR